MSRHWWDVLFGRRDTDAATEQRELERVRREKAELERLLRRLQAEVELPRRKWDQ